MRSSGVIPLAVRRSASGNVPDSDDADSVAAREPTSATSRLAEAAGLRVLPSIRGPVPGTSHGLLPGASTEGGRVPQPALDVDMDLIAMWESLSSSSARRKGPAIVMMIHNALTKVPIGHSIPASARLQPPLGLVGPAGD